jgi:hypothetical protein
MNKMSDVIARAEARQKTAEHILRELDLVNRWNQFGTCNLVGAVAYRLVVAPDIDMEIFCPEPRIEDGFEIIRECAFHIKVTRTRFWNALGPPHYGLYWQVRYKHDGEEWKIDMWSMADSYSEPCGVHLTEPMMNALTPEYRQTILGLKEVVRAEKTVDCPSIQIYRAVLDYGITDLNGLKSWLPENPLEGVVTDWKPGEKGQAAAECDEV